MRPWPCTDACTGSGHLHVVAILKEIQHSFAAVAFCAGNVVVFGSPFGGVDAERVFGLALIVNIGGHVGSTSLEVLVQEELEVVEQVHVRAAVDVLIERVRLVEGRFALRLGMAGRGSANSFAN